MPNEKIESPNNERYDPNKEGEKRMGFMIGENVIIPDDINKYDDEVMRLFGFSEEEITEEMRNRQHSQNLEN